MIPTRSQALPVEEDRPGQVPELRVAGLTGQLRAMPKFVVEGLTRGRLYSGRSLEQALTAMQRDVYQCRAEYHGPTDAKLYCDGVPVETAMGADGALGIAKTRPRPVLKPIEVPKKHWQR